MDDYTSSVMAAQRARDRNTAAIRRAAIDHLETFLRAKRKLPASGDWWPLFKRGPRAQSQVIEYRYPFNDPIHLDHVSYYDGGDIRYMVNEPYSDISAPDLEHFARVNGFDGWFRLPPEFGTHYPPQFGGVSHCRVYVFWKRRPST